AQNVELCEHLKVFQGAGLRVRALLDAVAKDPKGKEVYMQEIREESESLALWAIVLPHPVVSSTVVAMVEASLGLFSKGGVVRGLKRVGEGSGAGSEDRGKHV
ncbi:hypothetical protein K443DRAFT_15696, partial [Laccaria amethystina LaAM-08-1]